MPLCRCCQSAPIAHSVYVASEGLHHICHACFLKLDARLLAQKREAVNQQALASLRANAKEQVEIEKLEYWWALSEHNYVGQ